MTGLDRITVVGHHNKITPRQPAPQLKNHLPRPVAEQALRIALGQFMMESGGGIAKAARGDSTAGVIAAGRAIDAAARTCLLAERRPYPYGKWLIRAARETQLGRTVVPVLDEIASSLCELVEPPAGVGFREWRPIARVRELRSTIPKGLQELGWSDSWARDLGLNLPLAFVAE